MCPDRTDWPVADMCSSARAVSRHKLEEAPGLEKKKSANRIRGENLWSIFFAIHVSFLYSSLECQLEREKN